MNAHQFANALDDLINQARREGMSVEEIVDTVQSVMDDIEDGDSDESEDEEKDTG